jgi:oxygen-independent coproporphyrinogen-3 oxidase
MSRIIPIVPAGTRRHAQALEFRAQPPLSLYIHVPWCVRKCPYCDFNSHELRAGIPEAQYVEALIADLESSLPLVWGRRVVSIFIGGGTPSLLSGEAMEHLLQAVRTRLTVQPDAEITLEANPGTAEAARFTAYRAAGINRLSLGIQSFDDRHLRTLGRIHDAAEAREAVRLAALHFERFNLDMMYGLPGQSLAEALTDAETALSFTPRHLSCYQLTLEPNTRFAAHPPTLPESDLCADMQDAIEHRLAQAGYLHYETSAFAQPGFQCQHNLNYWLFGDYLGIGAGAHGKLTMHDRVLRQMRWKQPERYMQRAAAGQARQDEQSIAGEDLPFEFMMNALRLIDGFDPSLFTTRTAQPLFVVEATLRRAEEDGLLERSPTRIAPTDRGRRFLNELLRRFLG